MVRVWLQDAGGGSGAHQAAMNCVPDVRDQAMVGRRSAAGRLDPRTIALLYAHDRRPCCTHSTAAVVGLQEVDGRW